MLDSLRRYGRHSMVGLAVLLTAASCDDHSFSVDGEASLPAFKGEPTVYYTGKLDEPYNGIAYVTLRKNDENCHILGSGEKKGTRMVYLYASESGDCADVTEYVAFKGSGSIDGHITSEQLKAKTTEVTKSIRGTASRLEDEVLDVFN